MKVVCRSLGYAAFTP
ncbi:hypothetical protein M2G40_21370 [Vibrio vulnificus]|nr:hypothetical protein [Vibrio vulnificus]MCU8506142.1 hypothetical protein [Vibrio vulnificus]MCU8510343.1 hypothetical protein [Vibrio vulnificus]